MLQQPKGNKKLQSQTKEESYKRFNGYQKVSLGIFFSVCLVTLIPMALADNHYTIYIENGNDCKTSSSSSCLSDEGLVISQGSSVTWINNDGTFHTILSGMQEQGRSGEFDSGIILPNDEFSVTFQNNGYYEYYCDTHPWMKGMILVTP